MTGRARHADDDAGFALVFVLFVTTLIMIGVGTTLAVTTPNITNAKRSQDTGAALLAAQSGIDDAVAYLTSIPSCRSETRVCTQALGASSAALAGTAKQRPTLGTNQTFSWTTGSTTTADGYVRVTSTGKAAGVTERLVADISLQPSILSFGYYTDYESQSPDFLYDYFGPRTISLTDSGTYAKINADNTSGNAVSVTNSTSVSWQGPPTNGTNPYPASICGQHWYYESPTSPGRSSYGNGTSVWGEKGTINNNTMIRTSGCDVVFTSGMTEDGPIYSRDAFFISDGTRNGVGPIFKQPVYSLWGYGDYNNPLPAAATPWRKDPNYGGNISSTSPYKPQVATGDLTLPKTIGNDGVADDACVYYGPTRVVLNGDGTATVTSPATTKVHTGSDPQCYPSSLAGGIKNFTFDYTSEGSGTIYVQDAGTKPAAGWAENPTKLTNTPSSSNSIFYFPTTGSTAPDASTTTATTNCSSSVTYSSTVTAPCAWTGLATDTDGTSTNSWNSYTKSSTSGTCNNTFAATDREQFECEWSYPGLKNAMPSADGYAAVRALILTDLKSGACLAGSSTDQANCIVGKVNADLRGANTGDRAYSTSGANDGDHQYYAVATVGTSSTSSSQSVGGLPPSPMGSDSMFAFTGTRATERASRTPITVTVYRQTYSKPSRGTPAWNPGVGQFTFTATQSTWNIVSQASGAAYFPDVQDVTTYATGTTNTGAAGGSTAANQPGDLYVEGANAGKLSLIASNNVEVTGDLTDPANSTADTDAVDITASGDVRNFNPVSCKDTNASDINATTAGWCPNDITGLYDNVLESNGTLYPQHPAMQYTNINGTGAREIDAAIFALNGSFRTDNYNRGLALGNLNVNGGIYQSHRGANGIQWEYTGSGARPSSGYSLQYHFVDLNRSNLPYAPPATNGANTRVWNVVSVSAGS